MKQINSFFFIKFDVKLEKKKLNWGCINLWLEGHVKPIALWDTVVCVFVQLFLFI